MQLTLTLMLFTDITQLWCLTLGGCHCIFHTNTFFAPCNSLHSHVEFCMDIGIPSELHSGNANELTNGRWAELTKKYQIEVTMSEPYSPW
jgi:hypothetical protein